MREYKFIQNKNIMTLIDYLTALQDEYDFYAVDVHGVGFEWRIIRKNLERKDLIYWISIESVVNQKPTLFVAIHDLFDKNNQTWKLTQKQYDNLYSEITRIWRATGEQWKDRGLY